MCARATYPYVKFSFVVMTDDNDYLLNYMNTALHQFWYFVLSNRDVQLLIACCIADILRIFAPDAPYKEPAQIKTIFLFIIKQLGGLKDPKVITSISVTGTNYGPLRGTECT
jgi:sister-chromatid-cohesion protein PDS5